MLFFIESSKIAYSQSSLNSVETLAARAVLVRNLFVCADSPNCVSKHDFRAGVTAGTKVDHCANGCHAMIANSKIYLISMHDREIKEMENQSEKCFAKEEKRLDM